MHIDTRNATLSDLADLLKDQQARKVDMVVPATRLRADDGIIHVVGLDAIITDDGVTQVDGTYRPTSVFDEGLSEKLKIPLTYLRRMRADRTDLYDANVNGWLHGSVDADADPRSFLLRAFKPDTEDHGIARALLSDSYGKTDHLDALTAALNGIRQAGVNVVMERCDLTERRMTVRVVCPEVQVLAETMLKGYRNPFGSDFERWREVADREGLGYGGEEPIIFAGFRLSNSETGDGAFSIAPEVKIKVCANGLIITKDAMRKIHVGGKLDEGAIEWSNATHRKQLDLITSKTTDAVRTFLTHSYLERVVARIETAGAKEVRKVDEVREVVKRLSFTDTQIDGVLEHFIAGGQQTLGGVANAITSYSQLVSDADEAHKLELGAANLLGV
jgi:hypothetical protein